MKRKFNYMNAAGAGYTLGKLAYNAYKRYKGNGSSRSGDSKSTRMGYRGGGDPVTNQYDVRTQYKSKRQSRQKRRKGKKFQRFAKRLKLFDQAQRTQVFLDAYTSVGALNQQGWHGFLLAGPNGTANLNDDMRQLFISEYGAAITNGELIIKSQVMDIELVNTAVAGTTVVVDAYYVICRRDVSNAGYGNLQQAFTTAVGEQGTIAPGPAIIPNTPGVSPFDAPNFCEHFIIYKKQRLVLSGGQVASFIVKNKGRKVESTDTTQYTLMRGQKGILFLHSSVVTNLGVIPVSELSYSVNRSYHYIKNDASLEVGVQH
jgi:hypothetical protein